MKETDRTHHNTGEAGRSPVRPQAGVQPPAAGRNPLVGQPTLAGRHSFVVRIWQDEGAAAWRGWVQYTRTGEAAFVQELQELLSFIERRTGSLAP